MFSFQGLSVHGPFPDIAGLSFLNGSILGLDVGAGSGETQPVCASATPEPDDAQALPAALLPLRVGSGGRESKLRIGSIAD